MLITVNFNCKCMCDWCFHGLAFTLIPCSFLLVGGEIKLNASLSMISTDGITGLSLESFKENWSSDYQFTNNAGIPDPEGKVYWNFK